MPVQGRGYGPTRPGRIKEVGGNTANGTSRRTDVGGNTANTGRYKGQQHKFTGGNYIKGSKGNK